MLKRISVNSHLKLRGQNVPSQHKNKMEGGGKTLPSSRAPTLVDSSPLLRDAVSSEGQVIHSLSRFVPFVPVEFAFVSR